MQDKCQQPRKLERRDTFATQDILKLIRDNDLSDINTFLVLNGGTGVGKTRAIMVEAQEELSKKFNRHQSLLLVESRSVTVEQINRHYQDTIETFQGIDVCQRLSFMHQINKNTINYDWVVIDECHGLFSEASFAEDAEFIASWIRSQRINTHIIFITANDEYFEELSNKYFPGNFNFIYLFPDFTHYVSHTYVREIQFIKTNRTDNVLATLLKKQAGKKGIIFLKRASEIKDWFFRMISIGLQVGMIVSQANETSASLTSYQAKLAQNAAIDISDGQTGLTMADLCQLFDAMRNKHGQEGVREAVNNEHLPQDIDILLATDTLQEGINIKSHIDYIIIEGFTEVEVRQKLGRFRGNLDLLYLIFNPNAARVQTLEKMQIFNQLVEWEQNQNQTALAEFYGTQKGMKSRTIFLKKQIDEQGITTYHVNQPALYNCQAEVELYTRLMTNTQETIKLTYTYPLLTGVPKLLDYNNDIRSLNLKERAEEIAIRWKGIPLKGEKQTEFIRDFITENITDKNGRKITTFTRACNFLKQNNIRFNEKQATKKDLQDWPQCLTKPREKFKIIQ